VEDLNGILDRIAFGIERLGERIPQVVDNPLGYPQEAFVLAAMTAVALIMLLLVALIVIEGIPARSAARALGYRRDPERLVTRSGIAVAVVAAVFVAVSLVPLVPPAGDLCASCHEVAPAVAAWQADAHRGVSCYGCHARGGVAGSMQAGAEGMARLIGAGDDSADGAPVYQGRCLSCHGEVREGITGGPIAMRHSDVIEAGYACLQCHPQAGHDGLEQEPLPVTRSRMSTCLACHDGVRASSECTTCHDGRPSDTSASAPGGSAEAGVTCKGCHSEETDRTCVDCHGLELPHPEGFMREHARLSSRDPALCARCHEIASAVAGCSCHSETNVHGTYNEWFPVHGAAARSSWPGGCRCHADSFCLKCHDRIPL